MGWLDTALAIANSEIGKGVIKAGVTSLTSSNNNTGIVGAQAQVTGGLLSIPGVTAGGTIGVGNQATNQQMPVWLWPVIGVVGFAIIVIALFKKK